MDINQIYRLGSTPRHMDQDTFCRRGRVQGRQRPRHRVLPACFQSAIKPLRPMDVLVKAQKLHPGRRRIIGLRDSLAATFLPSVARAREG